MLQDIEAARARSETGAQASENKAKA